MQLFYGVLAGKEEEQETWGDSGTTKAEGWNTVRGSSQPEKHSDSCFFIGCQGAHLTSHWLKTSFQVLQENKGFAWLTCLEGQQREHCKESCSHPFFYSILVSLQFFYVHLWIDCVHQWLNQTTQTAICPVTGNSFCRCVQSRRGPLCALPWYSPMMSTHWHVIISEWLSCHSPHAPLSIEGVSWQNAICVCFVIC